MHLSKKEQKALKELQQKNSSENLASDFGLDAAQEGKPKSANPYSKDYFLHKHWLLGWLECHPDDFGINSE